jgi:hypothetical protein
MPPSGGETLHEWRTLGLRYNCFGARKHLPLKDHGDLRTNAATRAAREALAIRAVE